MKYFVQLGRRWTVEHTGTSRDVGGRQSRGVWFTPQDGGEAILGRVLGDVATYLRGYNS